MYLRVPDGGAQGRAYQLGAGRKDDIRTVGDGLLDKGIGVFARDGVEVGCVSTLPSNTVSSWVRPNSCWLVQELVPGARSCTKATFKWLGAVCLPGRIKSSRPVCFGAAGLSLTCTGSDFCRPAHRPQGVELFAQLAGA